MTRSRLVFVVFAGLALLFGSAALGQQERGDNALQLQGSLMFNFDSGTEDSGTVTVGWGRFVTDNHELGLNVITTIDQDGDIGGLLGPYWRYNFGAQKTVPFFGIAATTPFTESDLSGDVSLALEAGVRWFLKRNMAFSLTGRTFYDVDASDFSDRLDVLFGFTYFWKK